MRRWLIAVAAYAVVLVLYLVARSFVLPHTTAYEAEYSLLERCVLALRSLAVTVGLTLVPARLHLERTVVIAGWPGVILAMAGAIALVVLMVAGVWFRRRDPRVCFGITLFALAFVLTSNLIPINRTFAERWLYWSLVGLCIAVAANMDKALAAEPRRRVVLTFGWLVVGIFATLTIAQNRVWRDDLTLYQAALTRGGDAVRSHTNLASYYLGRGRLAEARRHLDQAVAINPRDCVALWDMGVWFAQHGECAKAADSFAHAQQAVPPLGGGDPLLASCLEQQGDERGAESMLLKAAQHDRLSATALKLARFHYRRGQLDETEQALHLALQKDQQHAVAHNLLGTVLVRKNELPEAERHFLQALRYDRFLIDAHANLAAIADARDNFELAQQHYKQALRLAPHQAGLHFALGVLLERQGQQVEAQREVQRALDLDPQFIAAHEFLEKLSRPNPSN